MYALKELFPDAADDGFTLHIHLKLHGGTSHTGDVVSFDADGEMEVGALHMAVEVVIGNDKASYALVSPFSLISTHTYHSTCTYTVTDAVKPVPASQLDALFTHFQPVDSSTCTILVPFELRPRAFWR